MNNKLKEIQGSFSKGLDKEGFFLSNLAVKSHVMPKVVNTLLVATLMSNTIVPVVQATEVVDKYSESAIIQAGEPSHNIKDSLANKYQKSAPMLTSDIIKDIASGKSGVYSMPYSGNAVFIFNKDNIELSSAEDELMLDSVLNEYFSGFKEMHFDAASFDDTSDVSFNLVKLGYGGYSAVIDDFSEKYPTFAKYEDLIVTLHEIAHAENRLSGVSHVLENDSLGIYEKELVNESYATIFSLVSLPHTESTLSNIEAIRVMKEHSEQRQNFANKMDVAHAVSYSINNLVSAVESDPTLIDTFRKMSYDQSVRFSESFAKLTTLDLAVDTELQDTYFLKGGRKDELPTVQKDVEHYLEHGEIREDSPMSDLMHRSSANNYNIAIKSIAEKMEENGGDFHNARRKAQAPDGSNAYKQYAFKTFQVLNGLSQLNDSINSYDVESKDAISFVSKSLDEASVLMPEMKSSKRYESNYNVL